MFNLLGYFWLGPNYYCLLLIYLICWLIVIYSSCWSIYLISKRYMTIADINIDHMLLMLLSYYCMLFSITLAWCYQWHHFDGFRSREFDVRALNKLVISSMYAFLGLHDVSENIFSQNTILNLARILGKYYIISTYIWEFLVTCHVHSWRSLKPVFQYFFSGIF